MFGQETLPEGMIIALPLRGFRARPEGKDITKIITLAIFNSYHSSGGTSYVVTHQGEGIAVQEVFSGGGVMGVAFDDKSLLHVCS